jgi:hypothetical protein
MAQIIKHRRGSINQISSVTANVGEFVIGTGSIGDLTAPVVFVGESAVAGGYRPISKIYQGTNAPDLVPGTWGTTLNGLPFYSTSDQKLYILNNGGNLGIDLTGNIEGNVISGVTINNLTGTTINATAVTSSTFTGSFIGDGSGLTSIPASSVVGLELNRIAEGTVTASVSTEGGLQVNSDIYATGSISGSNIIASGDISGSNLYLSGNANIDGNINLGGNIFIGDDPLDIIVFGGEVSSSIVPEVNNAFDLGSPTQAWRDLYVSGTAYIENISLESIEVNSILLPGDLTVSGTTTLSGSVVIEDNTTMNGDLTVTGSSSLNGNLTVTGSTTLSGSVVIEDNTTINGDLIVTGSSDLIGDLNVTGDTTFNGDVTITGLTDNRVVIVGTGGILEDDANFTFDGTKLNIGEGNFEVDSTTGDIRSSGSLQIISTLDVDGQSTLSSVNVEDLTENRIVIVGVDGELEDDANFTFDGTTFKVGDGNFEVDVNDGDIRTSGSLNVNTLNIDNNLNVGGTLTVTGSTSLLGDLYVSGNVQFLGSVTEVIISSSTVIIDDNIITLNAFSPFERYTGFEVIDSGSTGLSASLLWDSQNDYWMFVSSSGQSSKLIGTTAGTYGSEISLTTNSITKATGTSTIGDSLLSDDSTTLTYNTNKFTVTASDGATLIAGNVTLTSTGGSDATNKTSAIVFRNSSNLLGYVPTTETTDVMDGILGYKQSNGGLVFSTVIDGGGF